MSSELENLSILIVDCDRSMRLLARDMLNSMGVHQVYMESDGTTGYAELRNRKFDIVITERYMEPLDGIDLTRMIRTAVDSPNPRVPILMMATSPNITDVTEARDAGVTEFLIKPFSADSFKKRLSATVQNPRAFVRVDSYFGPDRRRTVREFNGEDLRGPKEG